VAEIYFTAITPMYQNSLFTSFNKLAAVHVYCQSTAAAVARQHI